MITWCKYNHVTLNSMGWMGCAILDAIDREPLPGVSPLWTHPDVVITPHISGPVTSDTVHALYVYKYFKFYIFVLTLRIDFFNLQA